MRKIELTTTKYSIETIFEIHVQSWSGPIFFSFSSLIIVSFWMCRIFISMNNESEKKRTPSETGGEKKNIPSPFEVYSRTNHESVRVFSTSMWKPSSSFSAFLQLRLLSFRLASMLCRNSVSFYFFLIYKDDTGYVLHAHKFTVAICHRSSWNAYSLIRTFFGCHSFRRSLTLAYGTVCVLWESAHKKGKSKKNTRNVKHFSDWFNCSALGKLL